MNLLSRTNNRHIVENKIKFNFILLLLSSILIFSACKSEDEPDNDTKLEGYWYCDSEALVLEIISAKDYHDMKGAEGNVYQLWFVGGRVPELYVEWTSVVGDSFLFNNEDYSWRDKPRISSISGNTLYLDGVDFYVFNRISKSEFYSLTRQ